MEAPAPSAADKGLNDLGGPNTLYERTVGVGPVLQHRKACIRVAAVPAEILAALILSLAAAVLPAQPVGEAAHIADPGGKALGLVRLIAAAAAVGGVDIPGHGRFSYQEVQDYIDSGKVIESYDKSTNTYSYRWNTNKKTK